MRLLSGLFLLVLLCSGCSQNKLFTKQDYQNSQQKFLQGDVQEALLAFPRGMEDGNFITTMEKSYLSLLQGKPQIKELQKHASVLESQVRYHVSREARTYFYVQTPEDYYASEHEVIWMHFLLSWGYSLQGQYEEACVEARQASSLLSLPWSPAGHFDDPAMRLFLATLWTMCGEWREAQVDFRAAWLMDNNLTWAKELADRDKPPSHLFLVMGGPGPDTEWEPKLTANPLRSARQISFKLRGAKRKLSLLDQHGMAIESHVSPDASQWYERHLARESELHEMITDSAYGSRVLVDSAQASGNIASRIGEGMLYGMATGAAVAVGVVVYAVLQDNKSASLSSYNINWGTVLGAGAVIGGIAGVAWGTLAGAGESADKMKQDLDPSLHYRYVRYLPEYFWLSWSDRPVAYPVELRAPTTQIVVQHPSVNNGVAVSIAQVPDVKISHCSYQIKNTSITVESLPDVDGNCPSDPNW